MGGRRGIEDGERTGKSREDPIVDRTNGDLNMLFKVTKLTKNSVILLLGEGRKRQWEMQVS